MRLARDADQSQGADRSISSDHAASAVLLNVTRIDGPKSLTVSARHADVSEAVAVDGPVPGDPVDVEIERPRPVQHRGRAVHRDHVPSTSSAIPRPSTRRMVVTRGWARTLTVRTACGHSGSTVTRATLSDPARPGGPARPDTAARQLAL